MKPRIVHLTTVHHPSDPRIFHKQLASLTAAGYETHLIAQNTHAETLAGIQIHPLTPIKQRLQRIKIQPEAYRKVIALAPKLVHFHDPELIPLAWMIQKRTGAKIIYDMHEDYKKQYLGWDGKLIRFMENWCFRWVDHVVLADANRQHIAPANTPQTLVSNYAKAIPFNFPRSPRAITPPVTLLYTGYIAQERGLQMLLDLAKYIQEKRKDWQLVLAGVCLKKEERDRANTFIQAEGLDEVVLRYGWETFLKTEAMQPLYAKANFGLCFRDDTPNHADTLPTKFFEYLQYGLPILITNHPRWQAFIDTHQVGVTTPYQDAQTAFEAIERLVENPSEYARLSQNALAASPQFTWEAEEKKLLALYEALLKPV